MRWPTLTLVAVVVAGCSGGLTAAQRTDTPTAPIVTPAAPATPTASPVLTKDEAAEAYLAVVTKRNAAVDALNKKYPKLDTLLRIHRYWKAAAKIERAFADAVRAIAFPPEVMLEAKLVVRRAAEEEAAELDMVGASSLAEADRMWTRFEKASLASRAASNALRGALGLPSVPVK